MQMTNDRFITPYQTYTCAICFKDEYNDVVIDKMLRFSAAAEKMGMSAFSDFVLLTLYLPSEEDRTALIMFEPFTNQD